MDESVALKWLLPEADSQDADRLLHAFLDGTVSLYAPDLLLIEAASGLWRAVVRRELAPADAKSIYRDLLTLPLNFQPSERLAAAAFSLALTHHHSVYDACYCALSVEMDCELITADRSLVAKLAGSLPYIRHVAAIHL